MLLRWGHNANKAPMQKLRSLRMVWMQREGTAAVLVCKWGNRGTYPQWGSRSRLSVVCCPEVSWGVCVCMCTSVQNPGIQQSHFLIRVWVLP